MVIIVTLVTIGTSVRMVMNLTIVSIATLVTVVRNVTVVRLPWAAESKGQENGRKMNILN
jgi:hypothetical protein